MSRIKHPNQRMRTLWALLAASETVNNVAHWLVAYYLAPVNPALIYIVFSQLHNFDTLMMIPLRMRIVSFILRCTKMDGRINRWVIIFCPIIVRMIFLVAWLGVYLATGNAVLGPIALICSEGFNATMDSIMAQYVALGARTGEVPSADEALRGLFVDADLLLHLGVSGALGIVGGPSV
ncbi:hypothetical protein CAUPRSCDRAFT_12379 [Caulochytrium protostelioides]|uniref:Uncharacterized protein n=1 Tax=Caulochytrium protostelioides TaxID=1555241 RepID=A0A4P9WWY2_9FUNG|nr:hypothetical protein CAUPRSCDRAFT_12379 [Caulochytrium protostelioides]